MDIPFSTKSKFFEPIERALRGWNGGMDRPLRVVLEPGGYQRDARVTIHSENPDTFWADWESNHPSRFSARVRAAATVLHRRGMNGRFRIVHEDGLMLIEAI